MAAGPAGVLLRRELQEATAGGHGPTMSTRCSAPVTPRLSRELPTRPVATHGRRVEGGIAAPLLSLRLPRSWRTGRGNSPSGTLGARVSRGRPAVSQPPATVYELIRQRRKLVKKIAPIDALFHWHKVALDSCPHDFQSQFLPTNFRSVVVNFMSAVTSPTIFRSRENHMSLELILEISPYLGCSQSILVWQ